jgi:hypothetical protein
LAVDALVVGEHRGGDLAEARHAQQQARPVGGVALEQVPLLRLQRRAADEHVVGQRLLADVVQQAGRVDDGLLAVVQPRGAGELVRVVRDGGGVVRGAGVAQRERLQQQPEHPLVADVELVAVALGLLALRLPLEQRAQQQLAHAEREREQPDDAGAVDLEAVDGHGGQRGGRELPRQDGEVDRAEEVRERSAAQQHRVAGDHHEVEDVDGDEHGEHRDGVATVRRRPAGLEPLEEEPADERERRVRRHVVDQVGAPGPAAQGVRDRAGDAHGDRRRGAEQGHREHEAQERAGDPEPLGVEREEVAADDEHGEQPDQLDRLPLLAVRQEHRGDDHGAQQDPLRPDEQPSPSAVGEGEPVRRPVLLEVGRARVVLRRSGSAHQRQRPADDHQPQGDGKPHDHTLHGSGTDPVWATGYEPHVDLWAQRRSRVMNAESHTRFRCHASCDALEGETRPTGGSAWAGSTSSRTADPAVTEVRPGQDGP